MRTWADFLSEINNRKLSPKNIITSHWYGWHIVSAFNNETSKYISESVSMGISKNADIAIKKALTEFCERTLIKVSNDPIAHLTSRTDGFSAFPMLDNLSAENAKNNAINEAVERYLWSTWWDSKKVFYKINQNKNLLSLQLDFDNMIKYFNLQKIEIIEITDSKTEFLLLILKATNSDGGVLTGGACEKLPLIEPTEINLKERAFGELLRHLLAYEKIKKSDLLNLSFYEQRLSGFASGQWKNIVEQRFKYIGQTPIELPEFVANNIVHHEHDDLVCLHRCLFKNQPIFMGGPLERLCI